MKTIIINIKELVQIRDKHLLKVSGKAMANLPSIQNAYLIIDNNLIADFGAMQNCPKGVFDKTIDASGKIILPSWCDSHTHIVYAGTRIQEFVDRINGFTYEEIANRGGGILNSANKLQNTSEDEIYNQSEKRLQEIIRLGTGAVEIKSGYGLTIESEIKMLRVIKKLSENYKIKIKATFLGAHALPNEYKNIPEEYIDVIINDMLPIIAKEKLADYIDVFCEKGYFSANQTNRILVAGRQHGFVPKIHVNQFNAIGGIEVAVKNNALTVDHLEILTDNDLEILKNSDTMPVALPSCSYFLSIPYTPARKIIDVGLPIALATDFNPGSTPSGNMNFVVATACIKMKMTPEEAINAATINGAFAMGISETHGSITVGKIANLIITKPIDSIYHLAYEFGNNLIENVILNGEMI